MRILREVLSPSQLERDSVKLDQLKKRYGIDDPNAGCGLQEEDLPAYAHLAIRQFLNFLSSYRTELFYNLDSCQTQYTRRETSLLKSLGL